MTKCAGVKLPTTNELEILKQAARPQIRYFLEIGVLTGFRLSEILLLSTTRDKGNYVDLERGTITLAKQKNRRLNEPFIIYPLLKSVLEEYIARYAQDITRCGGWYFWSPKGGHLAATTIQRAIEKLRRKTGLNDVYKVQKDGKKRHRFSMHSTRHYFICDVIGRFVEKYGFVDTNSVMVMSRHKSAASLDHYKVIDENTRRKIVLGVMAS